VDVDDKKIAAGFYANSDLGVRIPIVHFSLLAKNSEVRRMCIEGDVSFGKITKGAKKEIAAADVHTCIGVSKSKDGETSKRLINDNDSDAGAPTTAAKKRKLLHNLGPKDSKQLDVDSLPTLPVVVCVAMYRTNGVLERNVQSIGRVEGVDLWHFS
jgi:hypothetical protein